MAIKIIAGVHAFKYSKKKLTFNSFFSSKYRISFKETYHSPSSPITLEFSILFEIFISNCRKSSVGFFVHKTEFS